MRKGEYQIAICPHCGEESVFIPIQSWETSYEKHTGLQAFFPNVDLGAAECTRGCFITRSEKEHLETVDFIAEVDD